MNKEQFLKRLKELYDINLAIADRKNSDYATSFDPFKNFRLCEQLGICSVEVGMLVRICDKLSRISNLLEGEQPEVQDESIMDTLSDMANYSMILRVFIEQKNGEVR
jgi:hypothetical protein